MTPDQAKQYFFNRIRIQILKAQVGRRVCQDMRSLPALLLLNGLLNQDGIL